MNLPTKTCLILALLHLACGPSSWASDWPRTVDEVRERWLASLRPERFLKACEVEFRADSSFPDGHPPRYWEWMTGKMYADGKKRRLDFTTGPFLPDGDREDTLSAVTNGVSSAEARSNYMLISRYGKGNDHHSKNYLLVLLGIPHLDAHFVEAKQGFYWLPEVMRPANSYAIDPNPSETGGIPCLVVHKGIEDRLWFDCRGPVRLVRRDVWDTRYKLTHKLIEFDAYNKDGVPTRVRETTYRQPERLGEVTKINYVYNYHFSKISFRPPPPETFVLDVKPGVDLVDDRTSAKYRMNTKGEDALSGAVRNLPRHSRGHFSWIFWGNIMGGALVALVVTLNVRRRLLAKKPGDGGPP